MSLHLPWDFSEVQSRSERREWRPELTGRAEQEGGSFLWSRR